MYTVCPTPLQSPFTIHHLQSPSPSLSLPLAPSAQPCIHHLPYTITTSLHQSRPTPYNLHHHHHRHHQPRHRHLAPSIRHPPTAITLTDRRRDSEAGQGTQHTASREWLLQEAIFPPTCYLPGHLRVICCLLLVCLATCYVCVLLVSILYVFFFLIISFLLLTCLSCMSFFVPYFLLMCLSSMSYFCLTPV